ncbi:MAG: acylneuraminate cytidylyltransferase family protein [Verrucomicrobia bacterium]|nr:acylneuraminate cytidylyltransferase family protein [Verrucomicrobiota bacterium]
MKLGKVIAHIPARGGSKRVPAKNLRYLAGRPMIGYAIEAALGCPRLDEVYVNTDSERIAAYAASLGCRVYMRPAHLGSDEATGDDFTIDFIRAKAMDTLVMISPVCPLLEASDVTAAVETYEASPADTLISCAETKLQVFSEGRPVNINPEGPLAPTQKNPSVQVCNWAVTLWNAAVFRELYGRFQGGYCGRQRLLWPLEPLRAVKISEEKDFRLAEALLAARGSGPLGGAPQFWSADGPRPD